MTLTSQQLEAVLRLVIESVHAMEGVPPSYYVSMLVEWSNENLVMLEEIEKEVLK